MPTRTEILDTLAASQTRVLAFFHGLSPEDLERPATANGVPGAAPWRAKDHLAHLTKSERDIQHLLRRVLAGETPDVLLRPQYPAGMPMLGTLGNLSALTPKEERLELATAVPTVVGDQATGDLFAGRAGHAAEHMRSIEEGWRQGV